MTSFTGSSRPGCLFSGRVGVMDPGVRCERLQHCVGVNDTAQRDRFGPRDVPALPVTSDGRDVGLARAPNKRLECMKLDGERPELTEHLSVVSSLFQPQRCRRRDRGRGARCGWAVVRRIHW